jgi:hypothetical protein
VKTPSLMLVLLFASAAATAQEPAAAARVANAPTGATPARQATAQPVEKAKALSGMSVLGNQEAPKSLVIVPWKSARIGDPVGLQRKVDDARQPVDREVFMRELDYYELRTR